MKGKYLAEIEFLFDVSLRLIEVGLYSVTFLPTAQRAAERREAGFAAINESVAEVRLDDGLIKFCRWTSLDGSCNGIREDLQNAAEDMVWVDVGGSAMPNYHRQMW